MKYITAAIGNFDGIHIGHDKIINTCVEIGNQSNQEKKIITFEYEFKQFAHSAKQNKKIYGKNGKIASLKNYDIDDIIFFALDDSNYRMTPESFVADILIDKLRIKNIVVGFNFRFGYQAKGNIALLQELSRKYDYHIEVIEAVKQNNHIVSSTMIRHLIEAGKIVEANQLLADRFRIDLRDHLFTTLSESEIVIQDHDYALPPPGKYKIMNDEKEQMIEIDLWEGQTLIKYQEKAAIHSFEFLEEVFR
jgi:riboflavin kinase / FMN adenylyltransferase